MSTPSRSVKPMATTYRAKRVSTNQWLQAIDAFDPPEPETTFKKRMASTFGVPEADLGVVTSEWTAAQRERAAAEMGTGTHEGLGVIAAPKPPPPPDPNATLKRTIDAAIADALVAPTIKDVLREWKNRL